MNIDPDFEFDCPKWFDFTQDGELEESLDKSWFERDHPLHEPKDKEKSLRELKPLIDVNQKEPNRNKKTMASKTKENQKYKKSLERSVRLMRGDHGERGKRKLPEVTKLKRQNSPEGLKDNKEPRSGGREEKSVRKEFSVGKNYPDFTPPWENTSPYTTTVSGEEIDISPKTALCSPSYGSFVSPPIDSPKNTLLVNAINKAAGMGRKRRILPAIPCQNEGQEISHLPLRGNSQSEVQTPPLSLSESSAKTKEHNIKSPVKDPTSDKQLFIPVRQNLDLRSNVEGGQKQGSIADTSKGNPQKDGPISVEELLRLHNKKVFASKSKYDSNGRRIPRSTVSAVIPEALCNKGGSMKTNQGKQGEHFKEEKNFDNPVMDNLQDILNTDRNLVNLIPKVVESRNENQELTTEALLKMHNQKIMASKSKYDINGRRIRTANPSFCAAPSKSGVSTKAIVTKTKGRRSAPAITEVGQKRLSSSVTDSEVDTRLKQQRRSCVAVPKSCEIGCGPSKIDAYEKSPKSSTITAPAQTSKTSTSHLKGIALTQDAKTLQKNKRRSCIESTVSCASKGTGLMGQNRPKRRSCVAAPQRPRRLELDSVDEELKELIARHNQRLANNK